MCEKRDVTRRSSLNGARRNCRFNERPFVVEIGRRLAGHLEAERVHLPPGVVELRGQHVAVGHVGIVADEPLVEHAEVVARLQLRIEVDFAAEDPGQFHGDLGVGPAGRHRREQRVLLAVDLAAHRHLFETLFIVDERGVEHRRRGGAVHLQELIVVDVIFEAAEPAVGTVHHLVWIPGPQPAGIEHRTHRLHERMGRVARHLVRRQQTGERRVAGHLVFNDTDVRLQEDVRAVCRGGQRRFLEPAPGQTDQAEDENRTDTPTHAHKPSSVTHT